MGYIEALISGTPNLIKKLKKYQLEVVCGADVYNDQTSLITGAMILKQNVGNNLLGYFHGLWSAVNDIR